MFKADVQSAEKMVAQVHLAIIPCPGKLIKCS